jgi:hypothetical protein
MMADNKRLYGLKVVRLWHPHRRHEHPAPACAQAGWHNEKGVSETSSLTPDFIA